MVKTPPGSCPCERRHPAGRDGDARPPPGPPSRAGTRVDRDPYETTRVQEAAIPSIRYAIGYGG
jgi:hypothetical protein